MVNFWIGAERLWKCSGKTASNAGTGFLLYVF